MFNRNLKLRKGPEILRDEVLQFGNGPLPLDEREAYGIEIHRRLDVDAGPQTPDANPLIALFCARRPE